jgi:hypothetical protein
MSLLEQISNAAQSTTVGSIDDAVTELVVASAATFPSAGNFRVRIDDEIMLVTAVAGTTFTVARAQESTLAATHATGATVYGAITAGALTQMVLDRFPKDSSPTACKGQIRAPDPRYLKYYDGSVWQKYGPTVHIPETNRIVTGDFTATNVSNAVLTDNGDYAELKLVTPGVSHMLQQWIHATAPIVGVNTITMAVSFEKLTGNTATAGFEAYVGIALKQSGTGRITMCGWCFEQLTSAKYRIKNDFGYWTNATTRSSSHVNFVRNILPNNFGIYWIRVTYNRSTDRVTLDYSNDGRVWSTDVASFNISFTLSDIDQIGIGITAKNLTYDPTVNIWYFDYN